MDSYTKQTKYYFPKREQACYTCVVNVPSNSEKSTNILKYMREDLVDAKFNNLKKIYYTALGKERYSMYRTSYEIYANNLQNNGNWKYITEI